MKRLLFILLMFVVLVSSAQYRVIDWKTVVLNVVTITTDTYQFDAEPYDYNDPGATTRDIGNYFIDFVGARYSIISSDATTITVLDEYATGIAPQSSQIGRVYQSVGNGAAEYIGGVDLTPLDNSAQWKTVAADNELFWDEIAAGAAITSLKADSVIVDTLNGATYFSVQTLHDGIQSAGILTGGDITDGGLGTVDISAATGVIKTTNSVTGDNLSFDIAATTGLALTDETTNYIAVDYNSGVPQFIAGTTSTANGHTIFNLGIVYREGTGLDIISAGLKINDWSRRVQQHHNEEAALHFVSGAVVAETGTQNISITAGVMYAGLNRIVTDAINTAVTDDFEYYYYNGTAWIESDQTQIDNLQYNDISTGLVTLSNNQYGVHWVYKGTNSSTYVLYGQDSYTLAEAEEVQPPSSLPSHVENFGVLRAKIVIAKSATTFTEIINATGDEFSGTTASDHNSLTGLDSGEAGYYGHLTSGVTSDVSGNLTATGTVTGSQLISTIATGTSPLIVTSPTLVANLNTTFLMGQTDTYYLDLANSTGDSDDITEGSTHLFLTAAEQTILGNTSGTNTGDQDLSSYVQTVNSETPTTGNVDIDLQDVLNIDNTSSSHILFDGAPSAVTFSSGLQWGKLADPSVISSEISTIQSGTFQKQAIVFSNYEQDDYVTDATETFRIIPTGQLQANKYISTSSFPGTAVGLIGFTSSGLLTTESASGGGDVTSVGITGTDFGITNSPITTSGDIALSLATVNSNIGTYNNVTINAKGLATAGSNVSYLVSPLTTKGDLHTFSTVDARLPVGIDGQVLTADATEVTGMKWATPASGGTTDYISNLSLSGNTLTSTGVGSAFNSTVANIANTSYANTFTNDQKLSYYNPYLYFQPTLSTGSSSINFNNHLGGNAVALGYAIPENKFRIKTSTGFNAEIILATNGTDYLTLEDDGQLRLHAYTSTSSFTGTAVGLLGFDSSGNITSEALATGGGVTSIIGGTGVDASSSTGDVTLTFDGNELSENTSTLVGTDEILIVDGATSEKEQIQDFDLDIFGSGTATDNYVLTADGSGGSAWEAVSGGGDVTKVGTPVNNQIGVWTGDGTLEGDADLTFDGTNATVSGYVLSDVNRVQTLATTGTDTMDVASGMKASIAAMTGAIVLTITNLPDGYEGTIEVTNGSTAYTLNINGSTGYTTEVIMGTNAVIDPTVSSHTTISYWRSGSTLYYGFIYDN